MPRPTVLVFLVMMIVLTSRMELKPRTLPNELVASAAATTSHIYRFSDPQQSLKEKIILSQEQRIQKLIELVQTLKQQLELCRAISGNAVNDTRTSMTDFLNEIERQ